MRHRSLTVLAAAAAMSVFAPVSAETFRGRTVPPERRVEAPAAPKVRTHSRVRYEPNLGQWDPRIRFLGRGPDCQVLLADGEAVFRLGGPTANPDSFRPEQGPDALRPAGSGGVLRMEYVGGSSAAPMRPSGLRDSVSNYFLGDDRSRWRSSVPHFDEAAYRDLWPGIDLAFRGDPARIEYDLRVAPGADLAAARLRFTGQTAMNLDADGSLVLSMETGEVRHAAPRLWQDGADGRREVAGAFRILGKDTVGFEAGARDPDLPLVVDPVVNYSTFHGGTVQDWCEDVAVDSAGNMIVTGWTDSPGFPLSSAYQSTFGTGTNDAYVSKFAADGQTLVFSTYFGGSGFDDCTGVAVDSSDAIVICGYTSSTNFPTVNPFQLGNAGGVDDIYVAKFAPDGQSLVFSTYYGTTSQDQAYDVALDASGIYLAAATNAGLFPVVGGVQSGFGGGASDALIVKLNPTASSVIYATYMGGAAQDVAFGIAVDSTGAVRVVGETASPDFPRTSAFQNTFGGSGVNPFPGDVFVLKLNAAGSSVLWSSFLGGSSDDFCEDVAVNAAGETFLAGHTASSTFPVTAALKSNYAGGTYDAWCAKVVAGGASLAFCTYWGGGATEQVRGIAVDGAGNVLFCGLTSSGDFPLQSAFQTTYQGGAQGGPPIVNNDGFVVKLDTTGGQVRYSTYFGGASADDPAAMAVDSAGNAVIAGLTNGPGLPLVNPRQSTYAGGTVDTYLLRIALTPPSAPSVLVANLQGGAAIQLNWVDTSSTESNFEVQRKIGLGAFAPLATLTADSSSYQDLSVGPSTTYTYRVRAVSNDGPSGWTNEASATTGATITAPTSPNVLVASVVSSTQTALAWNDRSSNETNFEVQRRFVPGEYAVVATLPADTVTFNDTGLGPDSVVVYRVRAIGVTSPSAFSNESSTVTTASLSFTGVKASAKDSTTSAKDSAKAKGVYAFTAGTSDGVIDPVADGVTVLFGTEQAPASLIIPPADAGWVLKKTKATWKTPKGAPSKATVVFDTTKKTFSVALSGIQFPGTLANPLRVTLRIGNDAGSSRATWDNKKPGKFAYKQP